MDIAVFSHLPGRKMKDHSNNPYYVFLAILIHLISGISCQNEGEGGEGEHGEGGFKVFHSEWPRVEVPYVVCLWILTTTFVKLGKSISNSCSSR